MAGVRRLSAQDGARHPRRHPGEALDGVAARLSRAGFLAADDEAAQLIAAAGAGAGHLDALVERRLQGEPLAWVTGCTRFCGVDIHVHPGVFVPREHTEIVARRASRRLPAHGCAVDACTGCGAVAAYLMSRHPQAKVLGTDIDPVAVACARDNGVSALQGDLLEPVPQRLRGAVDVVVAVAPYVPSDSLRFLQRDTFTFESALAYDGGPAGVVLLQRLIAQAPRLLRRGGAIVLEVGGEQDAALEPVLTSHGFTRVTSHRDDDGDLRCVEATLSR